MGLLQRKSIQNGSTPSMNNRKTSETLPPSSSASLGTEARSLHSTNFSVSSQSEMENFAARAEEALKSEEEVKQLQKASILVGREKETEAICDYILNVLNKQEVVKMGSTSPSIERIKRPRVVCVWGAAGMGKSSVVQAALKRSLKEIEPIQERDDYYICQGKYTQGGAGDSEGTGLAACMKSLVRQIVERDWDMGIRRRLTEALSASDAEVLMETFPSLSLLFLHDDNSEDSNNHEPSINDECSYARSNSSSQLFPDASSSVNMNKARRGQRRQYLFQLLIDAIIKHKVNQYQDEDIVVEEESNQIQQEQSTEEGEALKETIRPLVIVLDDVQWADRASMDLISAVVRNSEVENLIFIVTCRLLDKSSPPFKKESERWNKQNLPVESLNLENLDERDTNNLVASLLDSYSAKIEPLASFIHQKTKGNPFYATELLKALVDEKMIKYNFGELEWTFDMSRIRSMKTATADGSVHLVQGKLRRLPSENHQKVLHVAACLGVTFTLSLLEDIILHIDIANLPLDEQSSAKGPETGKLNVKLLLKECVDAGILNNSMADGGVFFFVHDLVKEAALTVMDEKQSKMLKMRAGKYILKARETVKESVDQRLPLFLLGVDLCNAASSLLSPVTSRDELVTLARYNLLAGQKSARESAFDNAVRYMETGLQHLESGIRQTASDREESALLINLLAGAAEAVYCLGDYEKMELYSNRVLESQNCPQSTQMNMIFFKILSATVQEQHENALAIGRKAIEDLGVAKFPAKPSTLNVLVELFKTTRLLKKYSAEQLALLPVLKDEKRIVAMRILENCQAPAFCSNPNFLLVTCLREIRWSVKYGISQYTPTLFTIYCLIQVSIFGNGDANAMYSDVALRLAERLNVKETTSRTSMLSFALCRHWLSDMRSCYPPIVYSQRLALEGGDSITVMECFMHMNFMAWCTSMYPIQKLASDLLQAVTKCHEYKHQAILDACFYLAVGLRKLCLAGDGCFDWVDTPNIDKVTSNLERLHDPGVQVFYDSVDIQSNYLLGNNEKALKYANRTGGIGVTLTPGVVYAVQTQFYRGMVFLAEASQGRSKRKNLKFVNQVMTTLKKWIAGGNVNCVHRLRILEAEHARVTGKRDTAKELYAEAIQLASKSRHEQDAAVCHECAAILYLDVEDKVRAAHHVEQAARLFRNWGAQAKVELLAKKYSELLSKHGSTIFSLRKI